MVTFKLFLSNLSTQRGSIQRELSGKIKKKKKKKQQRVKRAKSFPGLRWGASRFILAALPAVRGSPALLALHLLPQTQP